MDITRSQFIRKVAKQGEFFVQDVERVFDAIEVSISECFGDVTLDEPVSVRISKGIKLTANVLPERERVDPRDHSPVICKETVRLGCKYSEGFKNNIQSLFEKNND